MEQPVQDREAFAKVVMKGAVSGFVATAPMTGFMLLMHRLLPKMQQYALPPEQITSKVVKKVKPVKKTSKQARQQLTLASHFVYGAGAGSVYSILASKIGLLKGLFGGILYGALLWLAGYMGWLPASGLLPPANKHPMQRNLLMIIAHLIYGGVLGLLVNRKNSSQSDSVSIEYKQEKKS